MAECQNVAKSASCNVLTSSFVCRCQVGARLYNQAVELQKRREALRLALLKTHYRQPLDFTRDGVREARQELNRFYRALALHETGVSDGEAHAVPNDVTDAV